MKFLLRNEGSLIFNYIHSTSKQKNGLDKFNEVSEYFMENLRKIIQKYLDKVNMDIEVEIHSLDKILQEKTKILQNNELPIISLDSYEQLKDTYPLGASRNFDWYTKELLKIGSRPGYADLSIQIETIKNKFKNKSIIISEDDIFTGGTIKNIIQELNEANIKVEKVIAGIQSDKSINFDFNIGAVFSFNKDEVFNLVDPRDFLFGSFEGGLSVCKDGKLFRLPYIYPFVDSSGRVGIRKEDEILLANDILDLNLVVFNKLEEILNTKVKIYNLWPHFTEFILNEYNLKPDEDVITMLDRIKDSIV